MTLQLLFRNTIKEENKYETLLSESLFLLYSYELKCIFCINVFLKFLNWNVRKLFGLKDGH